MSALVGLRDELPSIGQSVAWARGLAGELVARGFRVQPDPPHTNTFLVFAEADADAVTERVVSFMEERRTVPCGPWRPAQAPGLAVTEVACHRAALEHDPATVADWWSELVG